MLNTLSLDNIAVNFHPEGAPIVVRGDGGPMPKQPPPVLNIWIQHHSVLHCNRGRSRHSPEFCFFNKMI